MAGNPKRMVNTKHITRDGRPSHVCSVGLGGTKPVERRQSLRANLIDSATDEHGGRIVQTGGDSLLIVFDNIDGVVHCAVELQHQRTTSGMNMASRAWVRAFVWWVLIVVISLIIIALH